MRDARLRDGRSFITFAGAFLDVDSAVTEWRYARRSSWKLLLSGRQSDSIP